MDEVSYKEGYEDGLIDTTKKVHDILSVCLDYVLDAQTPDKVRSRVVAIMLVLQLECPDAWHTNLQNQYSALAASKDTGLNYRTLNQDTLVIKDACKKTSNS